MTAIPYKDVDDVLPRRGIRHRALRGLGRHFTMVLGGALLGLLALLSLLAPWISPYDPIDLDVIEPKLEGEERLAAPGPPAINVGRPRVGCRRRSRRRTPEIPVRVFGSSFRSAEPDARAALRRRLVPVAGMYVEEGLRGSSLWYSRVGGIAAQPRRIHSLRPSAGTAGFPPA